MPPDTDNGAVQSPDQRAAQRSSGTVTRASRIRAAAAAVVIAAGVLAALFGIHIWTGNSGKSRLETACASLLNVLSPPGSTFEQMSASLSAGDSVARMSYSVNTPDGTSKRTIILCAFDGTSAYGPLPKLVAVAINGHQLGPARLAFLNRFWLPSEEATAALPSGASTPPAQSQTTDKKTSG